MDIRKPGEEHDHSAARKSLLFQLPGQERFVGALFDEAPYGVFITGPDGHVKMCNPSAARIVDRTPAELVSKHFNDFTYPDDRGVGLGSLRDMMSGKSNRATIEKRYVRRDGTVIWVHLSVAAIRDGSGAVEFFLTCADDISEERRRQAALVESDRRIQGLLEAIPCLLFCVNAAGVLVHYKPSREDHLDIAPDAFLGKNLNEVLPPDVAHSMLTALDTARSSNTAVQIDYQIPDGVELRDYEAQIAPYGTDEAVVLVLDVTDRRQAERLRVQAQTAIIEGQREALRQISTPLIPIADGLIALPLVGPVDSERARQMLSTLMEGVVSYRAETVIIDITGVPSVDNEVARLFASATRVVNLLGAQAMLAGVRPDVAQRLIELDVDLRGLRTAGNFQSAIALALDRRRAHPQ